MTASRQRNADEDAAVAASELLSRVLRPRSIAIVGASESRPGLHAKPTLESGLEVFVVNPRRDEVWGRRAFPSLSAIGQPVDAVMSYLPAVPTVALAREAISLGAGGLVSIAAGFADAGDAGRSLQDELREICVGAGFPVIGPNGIGYINVPRKISLTMVTAHDRRAGGLSFVGQSGATLTALVFSSARNPSIGLNYLISSGNEAVVDIADYLDFLVDDDATTAIGLVVETVRRPGAFLAAAHRAAAVGKPVAALKLGRSARSQEIALSHTGAVTGDAWAYDVAFEQAGIAVARDVDDLVDRLQLFDQVPPSRRRRVRGVGILGMSGGTAALALDIATSVGVPVPALDSQAEWLAQALPECSVNNPIDIHGTMNASLEEIMRRHASASEIDVTLLTLPLSAADVHLEPQVRAFLDGTDGLDVIRVIANLSGAPAQWVRELAGEDVAIGTGIPGTLRAIQAMSRHVDAHDEWTARERRQVVELPAPVDLVPLEGGQSLVRFDAAMCILADRGFTCAGYVLIGDGDDLSATGLEFPEPYIVKLADVAHRTELGAVRVGVGAESFGEVVAELRGRAARQGAPTTVVVQRMVHGGGEAFIGIEPTHFGPMVVFGLGGVLIEVLRRIGGRMVPLTEKQALALTHEFDDTRVFDGLRGRPPWNRERLAGLLVAAGELAVDSQSWLESLDLNPLIATEDGFVVVDALMLSKSPISGAEA
jgi:acyl-CoA synthetase (NDP forming)